MQEKDFKQNSKQKGFQTILIHADISSRKHQQDKCILKPCMSLKFQQEEQVREQQKKSDIEENIDLWMKGGKEASGINKPCSTIFTSVLLYSQLPVTRGSFFTLNYGGYQVLNYGGPAGCFCFTWEHEDFEQFLAQPVDLYISVNSFPLTHTCNDCQKSFQLHQHYPLLSFSLNVSSPVWLSS